MYTELARCTLQLQDQGELPIACTQQPLLPVIVLEALVPQEQISEAVPGGQGGHLCLQLIHFQGADV